MTQPTIIPQQITTHQSTAQQQTTLLPQQTTVQQQTTAQQQTTLLPQQQTTEKKIKQVRFNNELMVETDTTQYTGCTGEFNGNHKIYIQDDNVYKLLNNVINRYRNNRIHTIRGSYKNRQNYPVDIDMVNVVIN